ncbi:MAG TPA: hypothetical protein DEO88_01265 [Syntrophobacteraceae bacterium]|nr:hypothetical protein [Syntrophobacteraceae bacterium]
MEYTSITRRRFLIEILALAGLVGLPSAALAQTPGMERRMDRRVDRGDRIGQRAENMAERSDDPLGVRGVERRQDRRDVRQDRRGDRYDRVY